MISCEGQTYILLYDFSLYAGLKFIYSRNKLYCSELKCFTFSFHCIGKLFQTKVLEIESHL